MSKRHINTIRLVMVTQTDGTGFILFLDFYKAFDTAEHHFILQSLKQFGDYKHPV